MLILSGFVSNDWASVALSITPEMLPMIINPNLCHAALTLAKLNVIVKPLGTVQTLGL